MADHPTSLGDYDDARPVDCHVVVDGRSWRASGTWIDRAQGPVVILQLRPETCPAVIEAEVRDTGRAH